MNKLLFCLLILSFTACVKDLPYTPDVAQKKVVVNCMLQNRDTQMLTLTYSNTLDNNSRLFSEAKEASVKLYENGTLAGSFQKYGYASWMLPFAPKEGAAYRLTVEVPGEPAFEATTIMPSPAVIKQVSTQNSFTKSFIQNTAPNPIWMFSLTNNKPAIPWHPLLKPIPPGTGEELQSDIGTDHPRADRFNQQSTMATFYPHLNPVTPAFLYYIHIPADVANINPVNFIIEAVTAKRSYIVIQSASKEYDDYLKTSLTKMFNYQIEDDPGNWFYEDIIYTNLKNGLGIFGAYYQTFFQYDTP